MRNREKIESVEYDDIDDEMLRSDLMGITQKLKAEIIDGGKKLKLRGYIGVAALGRNQTWVRTN